MLDKGTHPIKIFQVIKKIMPKFIIKLDNNNEELIKNDNIVCYLVDSSLEKKYIKEVASYAHQNELMILSIGENAANVCKELDLDGVVVYGLDKHKNQELKSIIGNQKAIGAVCSVSRHQAMLISEQEPDFVIFEYQEGDQFNGFLNWYNELFLIQSAVMVDDVTDNLEILDTDFVILKPSDYKILVAK